LGLSRLINKLKNNTNTDIPEGDTRYLAQELLSKDYNSVPDLKKCDVFSLGILTYELMEGQRVKSNGPQWHDLREDRIKFSNPLAYSIRTRKMVCSMLNSNAQLRPSIDELLKNYLQSEQERELDVYKVICRKLLMKVMQLSKIN
jgi:serine/threonine protein kinase